MGNKKGSSPEPEALKADYALLKQSLDKQEAAHARMLAETKSRRISRLNKEMSRRIRMSLCALPFGLALSFSTGWPIVFAVFVLLWILANVYYAVKMKRQLNADTLMTEEVKCATEKIIAYRNFYRNSLSVNSIVSLFLTLYVFDGLYQKAACPLFLILGLLCAFLAIVIEMIRYRKHCKMCQELLDPFDE